MKFFLINFVISLVAYGLTSFVYPSETAMVPRLFLMWAAPMLGTLVASLVTRVSLLGRALGAEALAFFTIIGISGVAFHEKAIFDTLQYVTTAYFLPGAALALMAGIIVKWALTLLKK